MTQADSLNLTLASDPVQLPAVRDQLRRWCDQHGWHDGQIADMVLAVDEALTNVIRHGYEGKLGGKIEFSAQITNEPDGATAVEIRVRDYGKQVPLEEICGRDLDDIRPGGLGVHIIKSIMSSSEYSHAQGGGMLLVMRMRKMDESEKADPPKRCP